MSDELWLVHTDVRDLPVEVPATWPGALADVAALALATAGEQTEGWTATAVEPVNEAARRSERR